jgi:hypothetical protein
MSAAVTSVGVEDEVIEVKVGVAKLEDRRVCPWRDLGFEEAIALLLVAGELLTEPVEIVSER